MTTRGHDTSRIQRRVVPAKREPTTYTVNGKTMTVKEILEAGLRTNPNLTDRLVHSRLARGTRDFTHLVAPSQKKQFKRVHLVIPPRHT